jgi:N-acyl homoserine lactone hydrolase
MPAGMADKAAPAMTKEEAEAYIASLVPPTPDPV